MPLSPCLPNTIQFTLARRSPNIHPLRVPDAGRLVKPGMGHMRPPGGTQGAGITTVPGEGLVRFGSCLFFGWLDAVRERAAWPWEEARESCRATTYHLHVSYLYSCPNVLHSRDAQWCCYTARLVRVAFRGLSFSVLLLASLFLFTFVSFVT
jgi:hypothetical protein